MDGILSQEEISALLNDTGSENATQNTSLTDNEKAVSYTHLTLPTT